MTLEPHVIPIDNPAKLNGMLCYAATDKQRVIDYYSRKFNEPPEHVYLWKDSMGVDQWWVVLR